MNNLIKRNVLLLAMCGLIFNSMKVNAQILTSNTNEQEHIIESNEGTFKVAAKELQQNSIFKSNNQTKFGHQKNEYGTKEYFSIEDSSSKDIIYEYSFNNREIIEHAVNGIEKDGSFVIVDRNNKLVGAIDSLRITDSKGIAINYDAALSSNKITYSIDTTNESLSYPLRGEIQLFVYSDFYHWFDSGSWLDREGEISLSLRHKSTFGGAGTSTGHIRYAFNTIKDKFSSSSKWYNEQSIYDQLWCHVNFAATKNPWNLEPHRPIVSLDELLQATCNP